MSVAQAIVDEEELDVKDSQMLEAIREFESECLPFLMAKGLVTSNSMEVTCLAAELFTAQSLNEADLITKHDVNISGQHLCEHFMVGQPFVNHTCYVAHSHDKNIFINLEAVLNLAADNAKAQTNSLRVAFVNRLSEILRHESLHGLKMLDLRYNPFSSQISELFARYGVPANVHYITAHELTAELGSIALGQTPEQELIELHELYRKILPFRKLNYATREMGERYPGLIITCQLLQDKNFTAYFVEQKKKEFIAQNHRPPSATETRAFEAAAQHKMTDNTVTEAEYRGLLQQIPDEDKRVWARRFYEQCLGPLPDLEITIPEEVLRWFERTTGVSGGSSGTVASRPATAD